MKSIIGAFIMALLFVCLAVPGLVFAGAEGSTAGRFVQVCTGRRRNKICRI